MAVLRVLHMIGSLNIGGSQSMIMDIYRKIDRESIQFDFIIDHPDQLYFANEIKELGGRIFTMPTFVGSNLFEIKRAWNQFFHEHPEYTILHSHVRSYASVYLPIAKKHGLFTIIHSHSTSNGEGFKAVIKNIIQYPIRFQADYFMACSDMAGEWLFGKAVLKKNNYKAIPNAIDVERFDYNIDKRNEVRSALGIENSFVVGNVGRFVAQKNPLFLVDIFSQICKIRDNAMLLLVGDGEEKAAMLKKIDDYGIRDKVILLGYKSDTQNYYQAMDVFVFPSIHEGLGIVAIEAQTSGLPCAVSEHIPEEANIKAGLFTKLKLDCGLDIWAETIVNAASRQRQGQTAATKRAGYDISKNARDMQNFYISINKNGKD